MAITTAPPPSAPTDVDPSPTAPAPRPARLPKLPAPHILVLVALGAAVAGQGGFYRNDALIVGVLLAGAVGAMVRLHPPSKGRRPVQPVTVALSAMALWTIVAGAVDGHVADALPTVALVAGVTATIAVVRRATQAQRQEVVHALVLLGAGAAATGWLGVVLRAQPWAHPDGGLWRAATTITYANGAAALLAAVAMLALSQIAVQLAVRLTARSSTLLRIGAFVVLVGLGTTLSRAGIAAFVAGFCLLAGLLGPRRMVATTARILVGAAIAVAGVLPSMPVGSHPRPLWAFAALLLGLAVAAPPVADRSRRQHPAAGYQRRGPTASVVVAAGAGVAALAVGSLLLMGVVHVDLGSLRTNRVTLASPDRGGETHAALAVVRHHLLTGVGPGAAVFVWSDSGQRLVVDRYAHDEYLQLAAEQGLIGLALLCALVLTIAEGARRGRRGSRDDPLARAMQAGAVAALLALAVHSGFDFLWHIPAVALVAAVAIGLTSSHQAIPAPTPKLQEETP